MTGNLSRSKNPNASSAGWIYRWRPHAVPCVGVSAFCQSRPCQTASGLVFIVRHLLFMAWLHFHPSILPYLVWLSKGTMRWLVRVEAAYRGNHTQANQVALWTAKGCIAIDGRRTGLSKAKLSACCT